MTTPSTHFSVVEEASLLKSTLYHSKFDVNGDRPPTLVDLPPSWCGTLPWLPQELVDHVFMLAAQSSKLAAASLCLVCRSSRLLVRSVLFQSLTLNQRTTAYALADHFCANLEVAALVRFLWMRQCVPKDVGLLISCRHLKGLAIIPHALSAMCKIGNSVERSSGLGSANLARPTQIVLFSGRMDWDTDVVCKSRAVVHSPFSYTLLTDLTHLYVSQASQLLSLLTLPYDLLSLTHLATPLAGISFSPMDIFRSPRFPQLRHLVVLPPKADPWLSPQCQFLAMQWRWDEKDLALTEEGWACDAKFTIFSEELLLKMWKVDPGLIWN